MTAVRINTGNAHRTVQEPNRYPTGIVFKISISAKYGPNKVNEGVYK